MQQQTAVTVVAQSTQACVAVFHLGAYINAYSLRCNFHQHPHGTLLTAPAPPAPAASSSSDQYRQNYNETPPGTGEQRATSPGIRRAAVLRWMDKAPMMMLLLLMLLVLLYAEDDDAEPTDRMKTVHT